MIARPFDGTIWSPLPGTATYNIARYTNALRITEMMYHPARGGDLGTAWHDWDYNDSGWPEGDVALGYGDSPLGTLILYDDATTRARAEFYPLRNKPRP